MSAVVLLLIAATYLVLVFAVCIAWRQLLRRNQDHNPWITNHNHTHWSDDDETQR